MDISYSRHARRQMKWREITEDEVKDTVLYPKSVEDSIKDRKNAFKHIGKKYLKVTFRKESNKITIVTAIDKNK
ncbi:MAG: DUF4258 domain-containing protein [Nitrospirae bacterium]|nr:DUF4258 domain-containing protein [Nitrospirota bacterium]